MTVHTFTLSNLKTIKNSVIGNPSAKLARAKDPHFVQKLVKCLNNPPLPEEAQGSQDDIRIEAAHVISSLSYGSPEALKSLLTANALDAFLYAISKFQLSDSVTLKAAFARGLRALAVAIADAVGPSQWGLHIEASDIRNDAKDALECLFQVEYLDIYLPLLDASLQTSTSIAQLLASAVRSPSHRRTVTDWLPREDRLKEVKGKRGWEKPETTNVNAPSRLGGWVARSLTALLRSRDSKLQEASLAALAALAKDNSTVASALARSNPDRNVPSALSLALSHCKSRVLDVQLAACLCATHIMRSSASALFTGTDLAHSLSIVHVLNRLISSSSESAANRTKACFVLYYLVTDNNELCQTALEHGSAKELATLVTTITPTENPSEWDQEEPEGICCLREAALTTIAALSLFDNETRREFTDNSALVTAIGVSLNHHHVGVRYAACQCVRALSRAVFVIRTNVVDTGIGMTVFQIFKKPDEDRRVTFAALLAICNLVNEFSPLRPAYLEQGIMPRLIELLHSNDPALRLNALWAIKNFLRKTTLDMKRDVMDHLGWRELAQLLSDPDDGVQEQAWSVVRNLSENELGVDMVFRELGSDTLLSELAVSLGSKDQDVLLQATYALANLANGSPSQQNLLLSHMPILTALRSCLAEANIETRRPAVSFVLILTRANPKRRKEFLDAGIITTLKRICEWTGVPSSSPVTRMGHHILVEEDKEVISQARAALDWLEHGGALDGGAF